MEKINIRNYTSEVPADRSILETENLLIAMGARNIAKNYTDAGKCAGISFSIPRPGHNGVVGFQLPAKVEPIKKLFLAKIKSRPTQEQVTRAGKQAERTAWRNVRASRLRW